MRCIWRRVRLAVLEPVPPTSSPRMAITRRLDLLSDALELDRERMRGWGIVHALAWGLGELVYEDMVACAGWLAAAR